VALALPSANVVTADGIDAAGVQANFERLAQATASLSASSGAVGLPPGLIFPFGGATAPAGYLVCNGASLATATYPALFAAIAYTYGGSGANFSLPDLQGRVPVGKGTNAAVNTLNQSDGLVVASRTPAHSHTVPKHKHGVSVSGSTGDFNSNHSHNNSAGGFFVGTINGNANVSTGGGGYGLHTTDGRLGNHSHTVTASGTAGSAADPSGDANLTSGTTSSPYLVINYIIKS
jgi:microcystin-dependent protein